MKSRIWKGVLVVLAASFVLGSAARAQSSDNDGCSNRTLEGDYAFRVSGEFFGQHGAVTLRDGVAMTHFDGGGGLTQVDFVMSNGTPLPGPADPGTRFHVDEKGTYRVNSDCTGDAEIHFPAPPGDHSGAVIKLMFVLSRGGNTIHTIVSELIPPGMSNPIPVLIHSEGERVSRPHRDDW